MSRPDGDSSDHTDIYSGFSPVPENRPRKFGKPFSRPTNCAAPPHRKPDGRALEGFRFPCRSGHVCQHSIPREYAVLVLINQARETDSLPACRSTTAAIATTAASSFCSCNRYQVLDSYVHTPIPSYIYTETAGCTVGLGEGKKRRKVK